MLKPQIQTFQSKVEKQLLQEYRKEYQEREDQLKLELLQAQQQNQGLKLIGTGIDQPTTVEESEVLDDVILNFVQDEFATLSDQILKQDLLDSQIRYVFALLNTKKFQLFKDMHMQGEPLISLDYQSLTFVDLGMSVMNEERDEKLYFIKVISKQNNPNRRDIYIMALNVDYISKWEYCLDLQKEPDFVDPFFGEVKTNLLSRIF